MSSDPPVAVPGPASERRPECVAAWPECESGGYDPRCCRFPKSCSCSVPGPASVSPAEPPEHHFTRDDRLHLLRSCVEYGGVNEILGDDLYARALRSLDSLAGTLAEAYQLRKEAIRAR